MYVASKKHKQEWSTFPMTCLFCSSDFNISPPSLGREACVRVPAHRLVSRECPGKGQLVPLPPSHNPSLNESAPLSVYWIGQHWPSAWRVLLLRSSSHSHRLNSCLISWPSHSWSPTHNASGTGLGGWLMQLIIIIDNNNNMYHILLEI